MQISFLWRLASMRSQKDCCGLHISLFTADVGLAVHLHLTTFLLLWSFPGQRLTGIFPGPKERRAGTGAGGGIALFYLENVNWNKYCR